MPEKRCFPLTFLSGHDMIYSMEKKKRRVSKKKDQVLLLSEIFAGHVFRMNGRIVSDVSISEHGILGFVSQEGLPGNHHQVLIFSRMSNEPENRFLDRVRKEISSFMELSPEEIILKAESEGFSKKRIFSS